MTAKDGGSNRNSEGGSRDVQQLEGSRSTLLTNPTQRWRVKLYQLDNGDWNDQGTGLCWGVISDNTATINVEDESESGTMLLEATVASNSRYQRHNALIIWKIDDVELALSFQEVLGCITLCEFLVHVHQSILPSVQLLSCSNTPDGAADLSELITSLLPPLPTQSNLALVNELLAQASETQYGHEAVVAYFTHCDYPRYIVDLFQSTKSNPALSSNERLKILYALSTLVKQILLFGESSLLELFLEDKYFTAALDVMEYDEEFGRKKANYRYFFEKQARFRQVVPINDEVIVEKIQKTFRLQLLKDVVLARLMDDTSFHMISSLIFLNQIDIIVWMQSTPEFSNALFGLFDAKNGPLEETEARDEGLQFTAHLTATSRPFQPTQRVTLYLIMVENGLFSVLNYGLAHSNRQMRNLALDIVGTILEADANVVWVDSAHRYNAPVINGLMNIFNNDNDPRLRRQACDALKALLESPIGPASEPEVLFYEETAPVLFEGIVKRYSEDPKSAHYFELALELLGFCLRKRPSPTTAIIENLDLFGIVSQLIASPPSKSTLLASLRCVRKFLIAADADKVMLLTPPDGCLSQVLKTMVSLGNVNNAVHSSGLELLMMISPSTEDKFARLRRWLATQPELAQLSYIPCTHTIVVSPLEPASNGETSEDEDLPKKRPVEEEQITPSKRVRDSKASRLSNPQASPRRSHSLPITSSPPETPPRLSPETPSPRRAVRIMSTPPATRQASTHETMLKMGSDDVPGPGTPRPRERQNLQKRLVAAKKFMLNRM